VPTIDATTMTDFATRLLAAGGVGGEEARLVAVSLVEANLRGHDSHGVMRVPYYLDGVRKREVVPGAQFRVFHETPMILTADGNWGFGQTQARRLTERLIEKVRATGVGIGTLIRCAHVGRLGEYCEQAAEAGLVSMMMVNTHGAARRVAPVGGTAPRLGTNPLAIGVPHVDGPLVLDIGTSATAEGKVRVRRIGGQLCPDGWLLDSKGRPTNDPNSLYADPPGTIRPMGGDQAYKGFGLALMIEIFAGALSGGVCAREKPINQLGNCVFLQLIDPAQLGGAAHFRTQVEERTEFVRSCPTVEGVSEVQLPGDPERRLRQERLTSGITLDDGNWAQLVKLAEELAVVTPE
jgi:hydroxycarboxylate dehydrogenase B